MPDWHGECSQEVLETNAALPCRCKQPTSHGRAGGTCVQCFWMPKTTIVWGFIGFGGWFCFFFFSDKLCKAELDSAGRLLVAGLKCLPELQGLVGLVPSVILPAF